MYAFGSTSLTAPNASASPSAVEQGQTSNLTSTAVTSGTSPYTYQWFAKAPSENYAKVGTNSTSYDFVTTSSTTTGSWSFIIQVTDKTSTAVNSTAVSVTVYSTLAAPTVTPAPVTVDQGQTAVLSSSAVTTGSGSYTYQWFAKAPGAGSYSLINDATSLNYTFVTSASTSTGSWGFILKVTDNTGATMNSTAVSVTVYSTLAAPTVTPAPVTVDQGQTAVLSSSAVTTGSGSYTYQWFAKAPRGSYAKVGTDSTSYNFTTSVHDATGSWSFILQVTDNTGKAVNSTAASVTVHSHPALPPWVIYLLIAIVVVAMLLIIVLFAWRRRARKTSKKNNQPGEVANQPANVPVEVNKAEISDNTVKFFIAKGRRKKEWVLVKEIPVLEIERIEKFGNELTVTSKGVTNTFFTKEKTNSFGALVEQVNGILEEQRNLQKTVETNEQTALRRTELLTVVNSSIGTVDLLFDVLIGLQDKHINWQQLEAYSNSLGENLNFTGQTLPPLNLNCQKIADSVKTHLPKEASKEAFSILKAAYTYFNSLNPEAATQETQPSIQTAKTLMQGYFMLNDLLLAKCVGEADSTRETGELEAALQSLAEANFKVNVEELKVSIDRVGLESDKQTLIEDSRAIYKEQLKQL
jgi:hypothetical protein